MGVNRNSYLSWLRKVHGWVGLWGATLGLLFGLTGFLLNHGARKLKISTGAPRVSTLQIPLLSIPATPTELAGWIKQELKLTGRLEKISRVPPHPVTWGRHTAMQPEHWQINIDRPRERVQIEYWIGNRQASVTCSADTLMTALTNLHKGRGLSVGWVLLVDTLAGSVVFLSFTGILLWVGTHRRRAFGIALFALPSVIAVLCVLM